MLSLRPRQYTVPDSDATHKCCEPQPADIRNNGTVLLGNLPETLKTNEAPAIIVDGRIVMSVFEIAAADDNATLLEDAVVPRFKGYADVVFFSN